MTVKKLVAFGCSWTYGDELVNSDLRIGNSIQGEKRDRLINQYRLDHCFSGLLAQHYDLQFENYGFSGASEESIRYALNWYLETHDISHTMIVVAHTDPSRKSWFNAQQSDPAWNRYMHSTWLKTSNPDIDDNWYNLQKLWLGMCCHDDWSKNNFAETAKLFDWVRLKYNIPVIQVKALKNSTTPNVDFFVDPHTSLQEILIEQKQSFFPGGHPTEQGHEILSKHLIDYIESHTLVR